jgi:hypothetical protein
MRFLLRLFTAFCVATVIAQAIILTMVAIRGNLRRDTFTEALALVNGIDISGEKLRKIVNDPQQIPVPSYDDVVAQRAQQNLNLEMRERSIKRYIEQLEVMQSKLRDDQVNFDRRKDAFYKLLDEMGENTRRENLGELQRTLEALDPEQAKILLMKMLENNQLIDVVAIIKGMTLEKRKKVLGEFTTEKEAAQLFEVLNQLRLGEPDASVIENARNEAETPAP